MTKRRTAAEIIAFHIGWDMREVSEHRYHPTRLRSPSIYGFDDGYYAAPADNKPPGNMKSAWREIGEHYGRKVFFCGTEIT